MTNYGYEFAEPPESAIHGDYIGMAVTTLWTERRHVAGNDSDKVGITVRSPFGKEVLIALPLVDEPGDPPEGMITIEGLQEAINKLMEIKADG